MSYFKDKIVWITGASSGIGEALAHEFAKRQSRLVLSARRVAELERVKNDLGLQDDAVLVLPLDLTNYAQMEDKVAQVMGHFGRIDVLINNGGISQRSLVKDTDISVYERLINVNYLGTVAISKAVLKVFLQQGSGQFGVVTSLMGKFSAPLRSGYCGAKHALHGFFDSLRMEYEKEHIKVNLICPGFIQTNISKNALLADGSAQNTMDDATDKGMSAEECAQRIAEALRKNRFETIMGGKETFAVYIKRLSPRLLHRIVSKAKVT
ncbi:MAG: SDR family oxidoreductase [Bacteroidota bacterium]